MHLCVNCKQRHLKTYRIHAMSPGAASYMRSEYIGPECWQFERPVYSATFIVSPDSIKMQWFNEITKDGFKVPIYEDIHKSSWISACDLVTYDLALTDYNKMAS